MTATGSQWKGSGALAVPIPAPDIRGQGLRGLEVNRGSAHSPSCLPYGYYYDDEKLPPQAGVTIKSEPMEPTELPYEEDWMLDEKALGSSLESGSSDFWNSSQNADYYALEEPIKMEDAFQLDRVDLKAGPTLAELNLTDDMWDSLDIDELLASSRTHHKLPSNVTKATNNSLNDSGLVSRDKQIVTSNQVLPTILVDDDPKLQENIDYLTSLLLGPTSGPKGGYVGSVTNNTVNNLSPPATSSDSSSVPVGIPCNATNSYSVSKSSPKANGFHPTVLPTTVAAVSETYTNTVLSSLLSAQNVTLQKSVTDSPKMSSSVSALPEAAAVAPITAPSPSSPAVTTPVPDPAPAPVPAFVPLAIAAAAPVCDSILPAVIPTIVATVTPAHAEAMVSEQKPSLRKRNSSMSIEYNFSSHDEGFGSQPDDGESDEGDEVSSDDESFYGDYDAKDLLGATTSDDANNKWALNMGRSRKGGQRYFWQYNVQSKGPKGTRIPAIEDQNGDPHILAEASDPVFSPDCHVEGVKHAGKARRGDGNDLTPNPRKLLMIGLELKKLSRVINELTPVAEVPVNARNRSRKEKNKLASRACRLKKKAQHEANKIKLFGLQQEHKKIMGALVDIRRMIRRSVEKKATQSQHHVVLYDQIVAQKGSTLEVAGKTTDFVNSVLDSVSSGCNNGGLEKV